MSVTAALITLNEEHNIEACLDTLRWADEIIIIDSGSTDQTVTKATKYTPKIHQIPFENFSAQKNHAIQLATSPWIFFIDADERVPETLAKEIVELTKNTMPDAVYALKRINYFFGRPLHFGDSKNDYPIRLFPREKAVYTQPVHEEILTELPVKRLKNTLNHWSTANFEQYKRKLRQYIPLEIETMKKNGRKVFFFDFLWRAPLKFIYLYFFRLGLLDGRSGFLYAFLSAWYDGLKYWQYNARRTA